MSPVPSESPSPPASHRDRILILDFGSQYTQLIARRLRELQVYCEIHPHRMSAAEARAFGPAGIVLSGGPASVLDASAPKLDPGVLDLGVPILGVCYGLQLLANDLGGVVEKADNREYGRAQLTLEPAADGAAPDPLLARFLAASGARERTVWMSHGDRVLRLPGGFEVLATSDGSPFAAVRHRERQIWGLQFHPEVSHTEHGAEIYAAFAKDVCGCTGSWTVYAFVEEAIARVRAQVGSGRVLC
jgi:GMP synthase (glutamine-hydrolysing)